MCGGPAGNARARGVIDAIAQELNVLAAVFFATGGQGREQCYLAKADRLRVHPRGRRVPGQHPGRGARFLRRPAGRGPLRGRVTIAATLDRLPADEPTDAIFREGVEAAVLDLLQEDPAPATRAA